MDIPERKIENLLTNFPNFISNELRRMPRGNWGDIDVHVRQGRLPECNGRIDLAFVTASTVYLVEIKRDVIHKSTLAQLRRYFEPIKSRYPGHQVKGFAIGSRCHDERSLRESIGNEPLWILIFRRDIPWYTNVVRCKECDAGADSACDICPCCGKPLH